VKKIRFRVTVTDPPPVPESIATAAPEAASSTVLVEGGVLPRPLTEPIPGAGHHRTFFVYADAAEEAMHRVRETTKLSAEHTLTAEEAGHVEDGVVHIPPDEEAAVVASVQDGRKAPGQ
jgi:hypothetical protein